MNQGLFLGFWLLVTALASAAERVALWPEGKIPNFQPQQIAATTQEVKAPGFKAAEHAMQYLNWYEAPAVTNGGCMLLISGGGYANCCDGKAFSPISTPWSDAGIASKTRRHRGRAATHGSGASGNS